MNKSTTLNRRYDWVMALLDTKAIVMKNTNTNQCIYLGINWDTYVKSMDDSLAKYG